jgi:DNA-directed RNA polymerase sigma subunit (sigma70/sigma32)
MELTRSPFRRSEVMEDPLSEVGLLRLAFAVDLKGDRDLSREHLIAAWSALGPGEREGLKIKLGLDGADPADLRNLAKMLKTTRERARQLSERSLAKFERAINFLAPKR